MQVYRELILEGSLPEVKAYLIGFARGREWPWEIRLCEEEEIDSESLGHKLLERLRLEKQITGIVAPESQAQQLVAASAREEAGAPAGFRVRSDRLIREATCPYHFEVYNREHAAELRQLLETPLPGIACQPEKLEEIEDPQAKGVELYAPEHDYTMRGKGRLCGAVADVITVRRRMGAIPRVVVGSIQLDLVDA